MNNIDTLLSIDHELKESGAIVRNGGRILIHEERFFAWIEKRSLKGDA
jgi:hypothetical protein